MPTIAELRAFVQRHHAAKPSASKPPEPPAQTTVGLPAYTQPPDATRDATERHHGQKPRQKQALSAIEVDERGELRSETDKKASSPRSCEHQSPGKPTKKGIAGAGCPFDDHVIYGLVLRAFGLDTEVTVTDINQRCIDAGFPGGAEAVTLAISRKFVGIRNGWNGLPYTAYITGNRPRQTDM